MFNGLNYLGMFLLTYIFDALAILPLNPCNIYFAQNEPKKYLDELFVKSVKNLPELHISKKETIDKYFTFGYLAWHVLTCFCHSNRYIEFYDDFGVSAPGALLSLLF